MSHSPTTYTLSSLGLPGALARAMTQGEHRQDVTYGEYVARITILVGLVAMLILALFGMLGTTVGSGLLEMVGLDPDLAKNSASSSGVMAIYGLTAVTSGAALIAATALVAGALGFRAGRRYDLR